MKITEDNAKAVYYETTYRERGKRQTYRTKSLTEMHAIIRGRCPGARTCIIDPSNIGPFGPACEIIERSPKAATR